MKPICFQYQYILKASIERVSDLVILGMLVQDISKPKFWLCQYARHSEPVKLGSNTRIPKSSICLSVCSFRKSKQSFLCTL